MRHSASRYIVALSIGLGGLGVLPAVASALRGEGRAVPGGSGQA